jgi:hypothetical protein
VPPLRCATSTRPATQLLDLSDGAPPLPVVLLLPGSWQPQAACLLDPLGCSELEPSAADAGGADEALLSRGGRASAGPPPVTKKSRSSWMTACASLKLDM